MMGQYAAGIAYIGGHPRYKDAVEGVYNFCGGGGEDLPDEATLLRSMRTLIPSISKQQVSFNFPIALVSNVYPPLITCLLLQPTRKALMKAPNILINLLPAKVGKAGLRTDELLYMGRFIRYLIDLT